MKSQKPRSKPHPAGPVQPLGGSRKAILIDNPTNLPLLPLDEFALFQGDLKKEPEKSALDKLMRSILDHHIFIAKAVFFEDGKPQTEDGHQTLFALRALRDLGYTKSIVISYAMKEGRMQEESRTEYDTIMVPYQVIVPVGETPEDRRRDAAKKLLQINSQYAKLNPETSFFKDLDLDRFDLDALLSETEVPDLDGMLARMGAVLKETDEFTEEFNSYNNENCLYPIVPRPSEKYGLVLIVCETEIDMAYIETLLQLRKEQSYQLRNSAITAKSYVTTARRVQEVCKSK